MNPQAITAAVSRARYLGLSASNLQALCILSVQGSCSLNHIASELAVSSAAVTSIADKLEHLTFASRSHNRHDRRGISLAITDHGREALADIIRDATVASWENLTPA